MPYILPQAADNVGAIQGYLAGVYGDPRSGLVSFPPAMVSFAGGKFQIGITHAEYQAIRMAEESGKYGMLVSDWYRPTLNTQSVTVAPFELARYPVTNSQWQLFIEAGGYQANQSWWDAAGRAWLEEAKRTEPSFWHDSRCGNQHSNYPIVGINWYEAMAFCRWLTLQLKDEFTYTLPSELEWEYACRGAERRVYAWGSQLPDGERANFSTTYDGTTSVVVFPLAQRPRDS